MPAKFKLKLKETKKVHVKHSKLTLLKFNQNFREKYRVSFQNKFEVLGEAEKMDQQWIKFKVVVVEAAVEQVRRDERKIKEKEIRVRNKIKQKWQRNSVALWREKVLQMQFISFDL